MTNRWRRLPKIHHVGLVVGCLFVLACAATLSHLVLSASLDKHQGRFAQLVVFTAGLTVGVGTVIASGQAPRRGSSWRGWFKSRPLAILLLGMYTAFGTMAGLLPLIAPAGATKDDVNELRAKIENNSAGEPDKIIGRIIGFWGEKDCSGVSYRFRAKGKALFIDSMRWAVGPRPPTYIGTWHTISENAIESRGDQPEASQGLDTTFTYESSGAVERLTWRDYVPNASPLVLNRCAT